MLPFQSIKLVSTNIANPFKMGVLLSVTNVFLILGLLVIFLLAYAIFFIYHKRLKRKKYEIVRPITDIIGEESERVAELNKDLEPFGFAYDPNQDLFYSNMYAWQRDFGYCRLYDEACPPLSMIIDSESIRFDYNGKKYLIEFWKGQYGMTTGGEVGIYYTTGPEVSIPGIFNGTFYYCVSDEDRIEMSFVFRKNGNLLFTRSGYHWWLTGFKLGEFSQPNELTMDITLTLDNKQMCDAFTKALKEAGYTNQEFTSRGRTVWIHFNTPHTKQPFSRTPLTTYIMQRNNESFCRAYQYLTHEYYDTLDKLEIVRNESPNMYRHILHMGKPMQVFEGFSKIKSFLSNKNDGKE